MSRFAVEPGLGVVPRERYLSPEFLALEWDRLWPRVWLLAGRLADIPRVGDYFLYELGLDSIIVVRESPDEIAAHHNVCQHRGTRLRHKASGHCDTLRCGYHGWEWKLDGSLLRVSDESCFPQGIPAERYRLPRVRCETWNGFVWINLDPDAPPLREYLGAIADHIAPYLLDRHDLVRDLTVEYDCNWKHFIDNSNETYHIQGIHPELLDSVEDLDVNPRLYERHSEFLVKFGTPSHRLARQPGIGAGLGGIMRKVGLDPERHAGPASSVRPALMRATRERFAAQGFDHPGLDDAGLIDNYQAYLFPNTIVNVVLPGFWLFRVRPHPTDPLKTLFDFQEYERTPRGRTPPPRPEHSQHAYGSISIDSVLDQDAYILPHVARGMQSRGFRQLTLGDQEVRLMHMHRTIDHYLFESSPATK